MLLHISSLMLATMYLCTWLKLHQKATWHYIAMHVYISFHFVLFPDGSMHSCSLVNHHQRRICGEPWTLQKIASVVPLQRENQIIWNSKCQEEIWREEEEGRRRRILKKFPLHSNARRAHIYLTTFKSFLSCRQLVFIITEWWGSCKMLCMDTNDKNGGGLYWGGIVERWQVKV